MPTILVITFATLIDSPTDLSVTTTNMHVTPVIQPSPEILPERDAGLAAAFEMLCERMGRLEEMAEHWLRRKREK